MKKLFLFVLLAVLAVLPAAVYAQECNCEDLQMQLDALTTKVNALAIQVNLLKNGESLDIVPEIDTSTDGFEPVIVGDFIVEFVSWEFDKNKFSDDEYINFRFRFTNNSSESASYGWKIKCQAFQDGIEMKSHTILDSEQGTEIRPGKSIEVIDGFILRDKETEIELEFSPLMAYKPDVITRVISIK